MRVYSPAEQEQLGEASIGFISFLESAGVLPPPMREMVIDRATAISGGPLDLEDLKIIVLMVFWSLGEEPDALILDELFVDEEDRLDSLSVSGPPRLQAAWAHRSVQQPAGIDVELGQRACAWRAR